MRDSNELASKEQLRDFEYRIAVDGERSFEDTTLFDANIRKYLKDLGLANETDKRRVCFVSGDDKTGPDNMIRVWCKEHGYAYLRFQTKWDDIDVEGAVVRERNNRKYNALARQLCDEEISEIANYLITFYDGVSSDTQDMIARMTDKHNLCRAVLVHVEKDEVNHGRKSFCS